MAEAERQVPDLIYTLKFKPAVTATRYLDYTEREEALTPNPEEDFNLERDYDDENVQHDPDEKFARYLGYTDRQAATVLEDGIENRYPTFTATSLNLSEAEHDELIQKINETENNKGILWVGVISFDPDFINRTGLRNPRTGDIDQHMLKRAIQRSLPAMLKNENMGGPETYWWGDIHLNTDHVHVHLTIGQTKNTRPIMDDGLPKGVFSLRSIKRFKSRLHHELASEQEINQDIDLEKDLHILRKDLKEEIQRQMSARQYFGQLQDIWKALPKYSDRRRWRSSNNSKEFRSAKKLTNEFVDRLLNNELKDEYAKFVDTLHKIDTRNKKKYGENAQEIFVKRDKELREYLANRVFDHFKEVTKEDLTSDFVSMKERVKEAGLSGNIVFVEENKHRLKQLDPASVEYRMLKRELGLRRNYIRVANLKVKNETLRAQIDLLAEQGVKNNVYSFYMQAMEEKIKLNHLLALPGWKRRKQPQLQQDLQELTKKYCEVDKVAINKVTDDLYRVRSNQLQAEKKIIQTNFHDINLQLLFPGVDQQKIFNEKIHSLDVQLEILRLKYQINQNNSIYRNDEVQRNTANRNLFKLLKENYALLSKKGANVSHSQKGKVQYASKPVREIEYSSPKLSNRLSLHALSRLMSSSRQSASRQLRAMRAFLDTDADLDVDEDREILLELKREEGMER